MCKAKASIIRIKFVNAVISALYVRIGFLTILTTRRNNVNTVAFKMSSNNMMLV